MQEAVLSLQNVCKNYGNFKAVDDISLSVPAGAVYGFLGPNGAGKTTTIRMILDIIRPSSGQLSVFQQGSALSARNRIGYLPEEKGLYKKMPASSLISYFAMLKGMPRKLARQRSTELLKKYGLAEFADAKIETLSKGMGQKVQVLATVAHDPELVILDEPFSGLDPVNQQVLEQLIRDLAANGQTVVFSTHIMEHAERLCDQIVLITGGKKIFDGSVSEARSVLPRRVLMATDGDLEFLNKHCAVENAVQLPFDQSGYQQWSIEISKGADPLAVLQTCFANNIALSRFEYSDPSLHDVFVHLVGNATQDQRLRCA